MSDIRWEEPPADLRTNRYARVIPELKARPGQWAIIADGRSPSAAYQLAVRIRQGVSGFGPGFEAVARKDGNGHAVYARYVGEQS